MCSRKYKVALCGKQNVGKTSIFLRMRDGDEFQWHEEHHRTQRADTCDISVTLENKEGTSETVEFTLWDTVDLERYNSLTRSHYEGSAAFLMVYSIDDLDSLNQVKDYHNQCTRYARGAPILLVRNKVDLTEEDIDYSVPLDEEKKLANQSLRFRNSRGSIRTSAKTDKGINTLKKTIAKVLLESRRSVPSPDTPTSPFKKYYVQPAQNDKDDNSTVSNSRCC